MGKGYEILLTSILTSGVHLDLATDYSTDAFLMCFRRFVSICGYPKQVYSNPRSQLVVILEQKSDVDLKPVASSR